MMIPSSVPSLPSVRVPAHIAPTSLDVPAGAGVRWLRYVPADGRDGGTVPAPSGAK